MLYKPPKTKRYIAIGAAALVILALVFWGVQKMKPKPMETSPALQGSAQNPLSPEAQAQKQKDMQDAINKANEPSAQNPLPPEAQAQKQQDMTDTINKANTEAPKIDENEAAKRQQDMKNAINAANKK